MEINKQLLISIILPTHNGSRHIKQSIESCLEQTYANLELIIVDDGSRDGAENIVKSYSDSRIKYFKHKENLGLARALNTGFKNSAGEYLTWQSDDNFYDLKAISVMVEALEKNPKIDFVYSNFYLIDENGKNIGRGKAASPKILDKYNCIGPCFLYRRKVYDKLGGFNPSYHLAEDYEYWLRVRSQFKLRKLDEFLCFYRLHKDSLTSRHKSAEIEEKIGEVIGKYIPLPSVKYYHKGKLLLYKKDYIGAEKELIKSLFYGPFDLYTWKLLVFVFLTVFFPSFALKIKKIRD